ncbi:hypothetical protein B7494_g7974 [Chlorociboria aeruginascens]|nr:hypothetical protein B7494_g7974 [Chlorociboria aeruginascens]
MADVRSLLKNERAARRIQHKHASYATGSLVCSLCHLQVKSESLWEAHLRLAGHAIQLQREEQPKVTPTHGKKRKTSDGEETIRKRNKAENALPESFFDPTVDMPPPPQEIQIPSRPATPLKATPNIPKMPDIDEEQWAAFEADIAAATEVPVEAIISAPAISAAELEARSIEESNAQRKERQEAEIEGDKEDATRKLEEEFAEMENLEQRVKRLREKRESLRAKGRQAEVTVQPTRIYTEDSEDNDDEEDVDDDWDGFRLKG